MVSFDRSSSATATLAVTLLARLAAAEPASDAERARSLFKEARALVRANQYPRACSKFEESRALDDGIGTAFNLADCWQRVGRVASAHTLFLDVAERTHALGQTDREITARDRAAALADDIPSLVVHVGVPSPGLEIRHDGVSIPSGAWETPVSVDPGKCSVEARAPGKKPWRTVVVISSGAARTTVEIPELEDEAPLESAALPPAPARQKSSVGLLALKSPAPPKARHAAASAEHGTPVLWILLGSAGVGAAATVASFAVYQHNNNRARDICPANTGCTPEEVSEHHAWVDAARTARTIGYGALGLTIASSIAAGAVYLTTGRSSETPSGRQTHWNGGVSAAPGSAGLFLGRAF